MERKCPVLPVSKMRGDCRRADPSEEKMCVEELSRHLMELVLGGPLCQSVGVMVETATDAAEPVIVVRGGRFGFGGRT